MPVGPSSPLAEPGGVGQGLRRRLRVGERRHHRDPSGDGSTEGGSSRPRKHAATGTSRRRGRGPRDRGFDVVGVGDVGRDVDHEQRVDLARRRGGTRPPARRRRRRPAAMRSTGFRTPPVGASSRRAPCSSAESSGTSSPAATHASAATMPGPPPLLITATRRPRRHRLVGEQRSPRRTARPGCRRG